MKCFVMLKSSWLCTICNVCLLFILIPEAIFHACGIPVGLAQSLEPLLGSLVGRPRPFGICHSLHCQLITMAGNTPQLDKAIVTNTFGDVTVLEDVHDVHSSGDCWGILVDDSKVCLKRELALGSTEFGSVQFMHLCIGYCSNALPRYSSVTSLPCVHVGCAT